MAAATAQSDVAADAAVDATSDASGGREPRADKVALVDEVRDRFAEAAAVLFTEYRGLDVTEMADLRGRLIDADCRYKIYKNTLVRRALSQAAPDGTDELLLGPTALAFCGTDPSAAAKALRSFASEHEALVIKGGVLSGALLSPVRVRELADLPSRDDLMAQMAGALGGTLSAIASMMNNLVAEMSGLMQSLVNKLPAEEPAVEPAAQPDTEPAAEPDDAAPAALADAEPAAQAEADPAAEPDPDQTDPDPTNPDPTNPDPTNKENNQ